MMFCQVLCVVTVGTTIFIHCIIISSLIVISYVAMLKISECKVPGIQSNFGFDTNVLLILYFMPAKFSYESC